MRVCVCMCLQARECVGRLKTLFLYPLADIRLMYNQGVTTVILGAQNKTRSNNY